MPVCPLTLTWVCGQPKTATKREEEEERDERWERDKKEGEQLSWGGRGGEGGGEERDYESIVLMKLRQAEERKRLCEELANSADT